MFLEKRKKKVVYPINKVVKAKCKRCDIVFECFYRSLCNQLSLCKKCISEIWGTKEFLEYLELSDDFNESDVFYYKKLFKIKG